MEGVLSSSIRPIRLVFFSKGGALINHTFVPHEPKQRSTGEPSLERHRETKDPILQLIIIPTPIRDNQFKLVLIQLQTSRLERTPGGFVLGTLCSPTRFSLAETLVLADGAIPLSPVVPASTMISARLNRVGSTVHA